MMDKREFFKKVKQDVDLKNFLADRDRSEGTQKQYQNWIFEYCYFHKMMPSELINEAIEEEQDHKIHPSRRLIKRRVLEYKQFRKNEKPLSPKVLQGRMSIIKAFYMFSDIEFPNVNNGAKVKRRLETDEDLPSNKQIKETLKYSNKKYRAIITLQASSGMRKSEIQNLKYKNFLFAIKDYIKVNNISNKYDIESIKEQLKNCEECIPTWKIFSGKTQTEYITFCTPECFNYILIYLEQRQNGPNPITSEEDYLFAGLPKINNPTGKISDSAYFKYFQRLNNELDLGKNKNQKKYGFLTSHQLRRFFATTLDGVTRREKADEMLGHVKGRIEGAYFKTKKEDLIKHYEKAIDLLTFDKPEIIDRTNEKIQELEARLKEKDKQIKAQDEQHQAEISKLMEKIDSVESKNDEFFAFLSKLSETTDVSHSKVLSDISEQNPLEVLAKAFKRVKEENKNQH